MSAKNTTGVTEKLSQEEMIIKAIEKTNLWIFSGVGIPANILVILVALSMRKMTSATFLLASLAFFDACCLVLKLVFRELYLYDISNNATCKLGFLTQFFGMMSNLTLVFFCVERSIAACSARSNSCNLVGLPRCVFTVLATAAALLSFLIPVYVVIQYYYPLFRSCVHDKKYSTIIKYVTWVQEGIIVMIPYAVLILLAVILALVGCLGQRHKPGYHSIDDPDTGTVVKEEQKDERLERSLSVMAFSSAVFVILFTLPSFIFFVFSMNRIYLGDLFYEIKFLLFDATHVLKFFIYLLVTDVFRKFFCKVCCGAKVDLSEHETITVQ